MLHTESDCHEYGAWGCLPIDTGHVSKVSYCLFGICKLFRHFKKKSITWARLAACKRCSAMCTVGYCGAQGITGVLAWLMQPQIWCLPVPAGWV